MEGIPVQCLNGTGSGIGAIEDIAQKTSVEDAIYIHLLQEAGRLKGINAPVNDYTELLGYVIAHWRTQGRYAALKTAAQTETELIAEGKLKTPFFKTIFDQYGEQLYGLGEILDNSDMDYQQIQDDVDVDQQQYEQEQDPAPSAPSSAPTNWWQQILPAIPSLITTAEGIINNQSQQHNPTNNGSGNGSGGSGNGGFPMWIIPVGIGGVAAIGLTIYLVTKPKEKAKK